ncbi:MAG TPA: DsbA family protein [Methanocella sp.]|nr:DsbA family protein [Methanocella sp.]
MPLPPYEVHRLIRPVGSQDHLQGSANSPAMLVEYGDYQCPFCGKAYPVVREVQRRLSDRLCFVFRNFPVTQVHPYAMQAAEAAEAAAAQGKFWEMHDLLYEHQQDLGVESLKHYAADLGLNVDRFSRELEGHFHAAKVRDEFMEGVRSGVNGTPAFYINGIRHDGSWELDQLLQAIENSMVQNPSEKVRR